MALVHVNFNDLIMINVINSFLYTVSRKVFFSLSSLDYIMMSKLQGLSQTKEKKTIGMQIVKQKRASVHFHTHKKAPKGGTTNGS